MKLLIVLSALVAIGSSAPKDVSSGSPTQMDLPSLPNLPVIDFKDLPDGYNNSTHEVKVVNGSRIEVNQTVSKSSDDGPVYAQIVVKVTSDKVHGFSLVANGIYGLVPSSVLSRNRRGLLEWLKKSFSRIHGNTIAQPIVSGEYFVSKDSSGEQTETFVKTKPQSAPLPDEASQAIERNDITYTGDTDVNYIGVQPRNNPDAEVFDINLVREDANRFIARRPQPMRSQPMRSQSIRSQPMRSQSIRSQPMRSQSIRSQPMRSQPIRPQPMRSQPIRSLPMRSQPMRSQPIRSSGVLHA